MILGNMEVTRMGSHDCFKVRKLFPRYKTFHEINNFLFSMFLFPRKWVGIYSHEDDKNEVIT